VSDWIENSLVKGVLLEIEKNIRIRELKLEQKVRKPGGKVCGDFLAHKDKS
jgi:hypothetical protein